MDKQAKRRRKPGARHYSDYSQEMLCVAVDLVACKKITSYEAEKQFGIPRRTILNKCKNLHKKNIGRPTKLSVEEEKHIAAVINLSAEFGSPLTLLDLRIVVYNYLEKNDRLQVFDGKMPGDRWVHSFITRHNFTQRATQNIKRCRAEKSISELVDFYKNLENSLCNIPAQNILNFDETNLSDDPGASKAIFKRGTKHPERIVNSTKTSVSIMFAGTGNGHCLPPYVVYKAEHLWTRWCRDGPPNARYNRTKSGWFDMAMFDDWFEFVVLPWANALNGTKLVIGDNLSSHLSVSTIELCQENEIKFVFLPKNATHLTQPLDLAFFGLMKKEWRKILLHYKLSNPSVSSINKCHFPQLLKKLMGKIDMNNNVNLKSGFLAAGICPFNPSKVTDKIPECTKKTEENFDTALLNYLQANRQAKPLKGGRNQKLQITPGKSVSTEEAEKICTKKVKPAKVKSNNNINSDIQNPKVTVLSDVKFTGDNTAFTLPLQLTEVDKHTDLFHALTLNRTSYTKPLPRTKMLSSTSDSDIEMSIHSDSDLMDIDGMSTDDFKYHNISRSGCDEINYITQDEKIERTQEHMITHDNTKFGETRKHLNENTDLEVSDISYIKDSFNIGQTVLTRYYNKKSWKYYVGEIKNISPDTKLYTIIFYKTIGTKKGTLKFIMPKRKIDKDIVPEDCIVKTIEMLQITEYPSSYVLMEDHDEVYFFK